MFRLGYLRRIGIKSTGSIWTSVLVPWLLIGFDGFGVDGSCKVPLRYRQRGVRTGGLD